MTSRLAPLVGRTPLVPLASPRLRNVDVAAKLELQNPTGSVKDRAAHFILDHVLASGEIDRETMIVESSSGNFGIALSAACRERGLSFTCVVDPFINPMNEFLIRQLGGRLVKVDQPDASGGYLQTRIATVKEICRRAPKSYWINQYANPLNARAYYESLGKEICDEAPRLDYVFLGVSSGGTITGVSQRVKERFPGARVVAVDMRGSVIFGEPPRKRVIPGIGSSIVPPILASALIDDVVHVDERETILGCHELLRRYALFCGGSSGSVYAAIEKYFRGRQLASRPSVVAVFADRGERYTDTIYDRNWYLKLVDEIPPLSERPPVSNRSRETDALPE